MKDLRRRTSSLETPCQICGSVGFASSIATCFQCREAREHIYCARVPLPSVPDIWLCEECRSSTGKTQSLMAVRDEHTTMALATNAPKRGLDCASGPTNSSCPSGRSSCKTVKLRTDSVEGIAAMSLSTEEAKLSMPSNVIPAGCSTVHTAARDSGSVISASGSSGPRKLSEGHILQTQKTPESKEACVVSKDHQPFVAFPPPKKKRRTLRMMSTNSSSNPRSITFRLRSLLL